MMTYPKGLIKSTVHAAAMYWAYLFSQLEKIIFPVRKIDFPRHKKSLRPEAIGETVALPDCLQSSVKRWQKYEEYLEPPKKKREILEESAGNMF
jgi:hypothetical protein